MPEQENFIKNKDERHKQKLIYSLTGKGIDLLPIILEIGLWSDKYAGSLLNDQKDFILAEAKKDRVKGVSAMKKKLYQTHIKS